MTLLLAEIKFRSDGGSHQVDEAVAAKPTLGPPKESEISRESSPAAQRYRSPHLAQRSIGYRALHLVRTRIISPKTNRLKRRHQAQPSESEKLGSCVFELAGVPDVPHFPSSTVFPCPRAAEFPGACRTQALR